MVTPGLEKMEEFAKKFGIELDAAGAGGVGVAGVNEMDGAIANAGVEGATAVTDGTGAVAVSGGTGIEAPADTETGAFVYSSVGFGEGLGAVEALGVLGLLSENGRAAIGGSFASVASCLIGAL